MSKSNSTTIILRYPDKDVPEAYLRSVLAAHPSCGGYAIQTLDKGVPTIVSDRMDTGVALEAVQDLLKGYASNLVLLSFSKMDKVEEGLLQPFDFTMPGDVTPLMSFAIEGDFPSLTEAGITEEANFSKKVIIPNFNKFLKFSEGDLAKFIAELKDPTFIDSLMARIGDRGVFCFLPPAGDAIWLGKDKLGSSYPWGQVSNHHHYKEVPAQPPVAKAGWWSAKGPTLPVAQEDPSAPVQPTPPVPLNAPSPDGTDTRITAPTSDPNTPPAGHWEELPKGLSQKDRKAFVRRVTGCGSILPEGFDKPGWKYWVTEYQLRARDLPELKDQLESVLKQNGYDQPKDMRAAGPRPSPSRGSEVITEANSLVLTADEKSVAESTMLKIMDRQGKEVPNPLDIQKSEAKYPTFTKQFGVTSDQIDAWLPVDIEAFAKANGKAFFHLFLETRREKIAAKATVASKATTTHALAHEELKPEAKAAAGGWSSWGKKN